MFKTFHILQLTLLLTSIFNHSTQAEIYKWIDENGKIHFSDKKINGTNQEAIKLNSTKSYWAKFDIKIKTKEVNLTISERQNIVNGVNYVYEFFDKILYFDIYKTVPVNILILKNRDVYVKYLIEHMGVSYTSSWGVYFRKENQIVVYLREDRDKTFRTIRHEVSHAIVDTIMPYAPAWLNEGLAEQMETINRSSSGLYIQPNIPNYRNVNWAKENDALTDISEFLKLPSDKWRHSLRNNRKSLQSQTGQFVYFLLSTPPNRNFVTRLMHQFSRGNRTLSYYLAEDNYIGGVKALDLNWAGWVKNQSKDVIRFY